MMVAPCPHCMGRELGIAETIQGEIGFQMTCLSCKANGPRGDTEDEAKVLWNGRRVSLEGEAVVEAALAWYEVWLTIGVAKPIREGHNGRLLSDLIEAVRKLREAQCGVI